MIVEGTCTVCGNADADLLDDFGKPIHLACAQERAEACADDGHQEFDNGRCFCGEVQVVKTRGVML